MSPMSIPDRPRLLICGSPAVVVSVISLIISLWSAPVSGEPEKSTAAEARATRLKAALRARCGTRRGLGVLISPRSPVSRQPLRVMVVSERPVPGAELVGRGPGGLLTSTDQLKRARSAGESPPYWWTATVKQARSGSYRFALVDPDGKVMACGRTLVGRGRKTEEAKPDAEVWWSTRRSWNRLRENLFSAWIERLFDAPVSERPTWSPLHQVLRDPARNFLYNHLDAGEDGPDNKTAARVKPDCADLPYFLRAYFAWKLRLPFGFRQCSRGSSRRPPRCKTFRTNLEAPLDRAAAPTPASRLTSFLRRRVSYVHSGAGRTAPGDDQTDFYPLRLQRDAIRPGAIYVDPAGHLLVVAKWVPQQGDRSGQLFAIESQPDLTVGRKRFWRGAFLFDPDTRGGGGGFKAFRPLVIREGQIVALTNEEIDKHRDYRNISSRQYRLGMDGFYDRVDRLINPRPLSPAAAYTEQLVALYELIQKRVDSVATGEDYMRGAGYKVVAMPRGTRIFQTSGPWEDYSTPSRDFRLLVAIHQVLGFPRKVAAQPDRFAIPAGSTPAAMVGRLERLEEQFTSQKTFSYTRSDGTTQTLTMAQLIARRKSLEMAYNPNDCVEIRWAAAGKELATCKRHAPEEQRRRMESYREWFAERRRPAR